MMEIKKTIPFPCYSYRIYVIFTDNVIKSADNLAKQGFVKKVHNIDDTTAGFTVKMPNQSCTFIVLKYDAPVNHLIHEGYHATCGIFAWIGATHEEEIFAYTQAYLIEMMIHDQTKVKSKFGGLTNG